MSFIINITIIKLSQKNNNIKNYLVNAYTNINFIVNAWVNYLYIYNILHIIKKKIRFLNCIFSLGTYFKFL